MGWISVLLFAILGLVMFATLRCLRPDKKRELTARDDTQPQGRGPRTTSNSGFDVQVVGQRPFRKSFNTLQVRHRLDRIDPDLYCEAALCLEDENPYDDQTVSVAIDGLKIGYLSHRVASVLRKELRREGFARHREFTADAHILWGDDEDVTRVMLNLRRWGVATTEPRAGRVGAPGVLDSGAGAGPAFS